MSAYVEGDPNNSERHEELLTDLKFLGYAPQIYVGEWEGSKELSIMIENIELEELTMLGQKYDQEAVGLFDGKEIQLIQL